MLGYSLLWVQPLGMLLGVIMFMAIAYQTLSTGVRPFAAMRRYVETLPQLDTTAVVGRRAFVQRAAAA
jgi:hypothetical protein